MEAKLEKTVNGFIRGVQKWNTNKILKYSQITWKETHHKSKLNVLKDLEINNPKIVSVEKLSDAAVVVRIEFTANGGTRVYSEAKVICEKGKFQPDPSGIWGVNPYSFLRINKIKEPGT